LKFPVGNLQHVIHKSIIRELFGGSTKENPALRPLSSKIAGFNCVKEKI
jgi:hypothetical protein